MKDFQKRKILSVIRIEFSKILGEDLDHDMGVGQGAFRDRRETAPQGRPGVARAPRPAPRR